MGKDKNKFLAILKNVFLETLDENEYDLTIFGSWAKGEQRETSDIDIALIPKVTKSKKESFDDILKLRQAIHESSFPHLYDVVNPELASEEIKQSIEQEKVLVDVMLNSNNKDG
ncbi:MAG: nucleotidyltransferase family protein [Candidatus Dojkabacteria bacterium]